MKIEIYYDEDVKGGLIIINDGEIVFNGEMSHKDLSNPAESGVNVKPYTFGDEKPLERVIGDFVTYSIKSEMNKRFNR